MVALGCPGGPAGPPHHAGSKHLRTATKAEADGWMGGGGRPSSLVKSCQTLQFLKNILDAKQRYPAKSDHKKITGVRQFTNVMLAPIEGRSSGHFQSIPITFQKFHFKERMRTGVGLGQGSFFAEGTHNAGVPERTSGKVGRRYPASRHGTTGTRHASAILMAGRDAQLGNFFWSNLHGLQVFRDDDLGIGFHGAQGFGVGKALGFFAVDAEDAFDVAGQFLDVALQFVLIRMTGIGV